MKLNWIFFSFLVLVLFNVVFVLGQIEVEVGESSVILCDPLEENCNVEYTLEEDSVIFEITESGSFIVINDHLYSNLGEGSFFKVDEKGDIFEAFIIASNKSTYIIGEDFYELSAGQTLNFKDGRIEIKGGRIVEGELFNFEFFPKGGKSISIESTDSIFIDFDENGNSIFLGNFLLEEDEINGLEGTKGKVTLSNEGKIIKIWENTKAKIQGIEHSSKSGLNIYYDPLFDPKEHKDENYFSYSSESIFAGGEGFSFELLEDNFLYPEMEFEKEVYGFDEPKKADFIVELLGGNLKISKEESKLIIDSEGTFNFKNGMINFISRDGVIYNSISKENNGFAQDLVLNNDYVLENSKLEYKETPYKFNVAPSENTIESVKNYDYAKRNVIREYIKEEDGVRARDFHGYFNGKEEEKIAEWVYKGVESANKNKYGIKITASELITTALLEGLGAEYSFLDEKSEINYYNNPNAPVNSLEDVGIDFLGHPDELARLEAGDFIPRDLGFVGLESDITLEYGTPIYPGEFTNLGEALKGVAGVLAQRKYAFIRDFKEYYGEQEFNKLSEDQIFYGASVYYNIGERAGYAQFTGSEYYVQKEEGRVKLKGVGKEELFSRVEKERAASDIYNFKNNAKLKMATNKLIKEMGYFSFF